MNRKKECGIVILSLIGIVAGALSTRITLNIYKFGLEHPSFCSVNQWINCDLVVGSRYAEFLGVPNGWWGVLYYAWVLVLGLTLFWTSNPKSCGAKGLFASWIAMLYSLFMAYISFFVLKALCLTCVVIYFVNLFLLLFWMWITGGIFPNRELFRDIVYPLSFALAIFGMGGLGMYQATAKIKGVSSSDVNAIVHVHFRSSEYALEIPENAPTLGNPDASVTMVEFSDFQCPYCRDAAFKLKSTVQEFKDQMRFVFLHYPLDPACNSHGGGHTVSCIAAQASVCAQNQGDFWSYHDDLFRNQRKINRDLLIHLAKQRGWNEEDFSRCLESAETIATVKTHIALAQKIYVGGTPTIFINKRSVKWWKFPDVLRKIILTEIEKHS